MSERDTSGLLPMLSEQVEHVVRFTPSWRGYARHEVDAYVTRAERDLSALRSRVEELEAAVQATDARALDSAAEASRWRAMYEESVPPFEELGTRVGEILGLAERDARDRRQAAEEEASVLIAEAGARAAALVTEAEERASGREREAEQRAADLVASADERAAAREHAAEEREHAADEQATTLVTEAETRATTVVAEAEEAAAIRVRESSEQVAALRQEHATLVERLTGIRDALTGMPGLVAIAAAAGSTEASAEPDTGQPQGEPTTGRHASVDAIRGTDEPDEAAATGPDDVPRGSPEESEAGPEPPADVPDPDATIVGALPAVDETTVVPGEAVRDAVGHGAQGPPGGVGGRRRR